MFADDLKAGQAIEHQLAELLRSRGHIVEMNQATTLEGMRHYDMTVSGSNAEWTHWVEVKFDRMAPQTGNVAVEIQALSYTKADIYVYSISGQFWKIPTVNLIKLASCNAFRLCAGGDYGRKALRLVPVEVFTSHSTQV